MSRNFQTEPKVSNIINTSDKYSLSDFVQKPIEIYLFIDPLCSKTWSLEPYLKKLSIEYGRFFTIRPIISGDLCTLNKGEINKVKSLKHIKNNDVHTQVGPKPGVFPWVALAIKAAELQGKSAGRIFLRKVQESFFLKKRDLSNKALIIRCAKESNLDIDEFNKDLFSDSAKKAFQCDLKLKKEMDIDYTPTIVFFNHIAEDEGLKISGLYPYDTYVDILIEMLQIEPIPTEKPSLEELLITYGVLSTKEISIVFDWPLPEAEKKMKKLQLKQKVKKITGNLGVFWKYIK